MAKQQSATEKQAPKTKRIPHGQAANQVVAELAGKSTLGELATKADALVVASGGDSNVRRATHHVRQALETAASLGVVALTKPTDIMVEKVKATK